MPARIAAYRVLMDLMNTPVRLEKLLAQELERMAGDDDRNKRLASNLVYSVLRNRNYLDHLLAAHVDRPLAKLEPGVLTVLRLGAVQLVLISTPDYAAVDSAVDLAKDQRLQRASGLVNGVLRNLARDWWRIPLPDPHSEKALYLAVKHSHPRWLVDQILERWGFTRTDRWFWANQAEPRLMLRINPLRADLEQVLDFMSSHSEFIKDHPLVPEVLALSGVAGPAANLPGFKEGLWQVQDAGAAAISHLLGVEPGMRVLDLCAGAGGKTGHLAALLEGQGQLVAVDHSPGRIRALRKNLARLGVDMAEVIQADARRLKGLAGSFDRILVDAPCTGLGTIGRRPDIRWRRSPQDADVLAKLQSALLDSAAELLSPGGALLYCTCTITKAENEDVAQAFLSRHRGFKPVWDREKAGAPAQAIGEDGYFRTFPNEHGCDAFFGARFVKE